MSFFLLKLSSLRSIHGRIFESRKDTILVIFVIGFSTLNGIVNAAGIVTILPLLTLVSDFEAAVVQFPVGYFYGLLGRPENSAFIAYYAWIVGCFLVLSSLVMILDNFLKA